MSWARPDVGPEEFSALRESFEANWISQGPKVAEFEGRVAAHARRRHCVALNSGSSALLAVLTALGVSSGAEVVVPAMAFIAVPYAVSLLGALPVLADVEAETGMISSETVAPCLTGKTAAVVGIDYSGFSNDWTALADLCRARGVAFVADSASSFLASRGGRPAGSYGDAATFSFHAAKPFTTGEGGAVVTDDEGLAARLRRVRNYGEVSGRKYAYDLLGGNYRMTDLAAAVGLSQLRRADSILERRRRVLGDYLRHETARALALSLYTDADAEPNGFTFTIKCEGRERVAAGLAERGIETRVMWPLCVDRQPVYQRLPFRLAGDIPGARAFSRSALSLPLHAGVGPAEVERVVAALEEFPSALAG